jgi:hypothetical protein
MKLHGHKFSADLKYTFSRFSLENCQKCGRPKREHAGEKCLFESTMYRPSELLDFFELFMRKGGTLTLKVGTQTLMQKVYGVAIDQGANLVMGDFRSEGDAFLQDTADAKER